MFVAIMVLFFSSTADADDDPPVDCDNAKSTYELNTCADRAFQKADDALNAAYKKALAHAAKNGMEKPYDSESWQKALRESQRAWVAFRDADCKGLVPMAWGGGSATSGEVLGCMIEKTEARTKELVDRYGQE